MAINPMVQSVLLFSHHQTTTPFLPNPGMSAQAQGTLGRSAPASIQVAKPVEEKEPDPKEAEQTEEEDEENEESEETEEEEKNG